MIVSSLPKTALFALLERANDGHGLLAIIDSVSEEVAESEQSSTDSPNQSDEILSSSYGSAGVPEF